MSTYDTTNSFRCWPASDYTYLLPGYGAARSITIDTCVSGVAAWDTQLHVFAEESGPCFTCPPTVASDDDGSECGQARSRVTFTAYAGVDYLVIVEGFYSYECGVPAISVSSSLLALPPLIIHHHRRPPSPPPAQGSCGNPYVMHPAFALGNRTFLPRASTCTTIDSSPCQYGSDYTFLVPAYAFDRIITLDTCPGRAAEAWDTVLFVFPATSDACDSCPGEALVDDNSSSCGQWTSSRLTFTALAGQEYMTVVEGAYWYDCGLPFIRFISRRI